ncbi:MAG TPA: endolytic transglycosylase MltG, partial [Trueperaceae bacterium]|nr:endolytic transglycosylase MltG [Trueperaceae bacterium]
RVFGAYLRFRDLDHSIGEGLYDLTPAMSSADIAARLVEGGRPRVVNIVIPEGWRAANVVDRLAANGVSTLDDLAAVVSDPVELSIPFLPPDRPLEGFLFPAVYEVPIKAAADEALALMIQRFRMELDDIDPAERLQELGLSVYGWVTLASMVQAEAASDEEMPIIAGVFANRLELGMLLQSDPTVAYGLGKQLPELSAVAGDLRVDTPWNTYTRAGLPFGPIGNPGREALLAVLSPERYTSDGALYLYFLHGTDAGVPVFRPNTNLPAHNRDVETYLRNDGSR